MQTLSAGSMMGAAVKNPPVVLDQSMVFDTAKDKDSGSIVLTDSNQTMESTAGASQFNFIPATVASGRRRNAGGQYYFETRCDTNAGFDSVTLFDTTSNSFPSGSYGSEINGGGYLGWSAGVRAYGHDTNYYDYTTLTLNDANRWVAGEYIAMCIDFDTDKIEWYIDGANIHTGGPTIAFIDDVDYVPCIKPYGLGKFGWEPIIQYPIAGYTPWG